MVSNQQSSGYVGHRPPELFIPVVTCWGGLLELLHASSSATTVTL